MKALFFLLVIANISLFLWEYKTGALTPTIAQHSTTDQEPLFLLNEAKNIPRKPQQPAATPEPATLIGPANIRMNCYEAGPFVDEQTYQAWLNQLGNIKSNTVNRQKHLISHYLLYYPVTEPNATPEESVAKLTSQGLNDVAVINSGEDKNKISLGLFNTEQQALIVKNQMLAKGINSEIKAQYQTETETYVLIKDDGKATASLETLRMAYPRIGIRQNTEHENTCQ